MTGRRIELFLVDGVPGGTTIARVAGWTGCVLVAPRERLDEALRRPEARGAGLYLLVGDRQGPKGSPSGESCWGIGPISELTGGSGGAGPGLPGGGPWDRMVLVTAADDALTDLHWASLQARLVERAAAAEETLMAGTLVPGAPPIPEAQVSDVEAFLDQLRIILPVLGITAVAAQSGPAPVEAPPPRTGGTPSSPVFSLVDPRRGVDARARMEGEDFVLLAGSRVVPEWENTGRTAATRRSYAAYKAQYDGFVADGSIVVERGRGRLTRDIAFATPSGAGAIAIGHSCNGPTAWTWEGGTYGEWARTRR
jgi:hypothetical protein